MIVVQKQYSQDYYVLVFAGQPTEQKDARVISPEFQTEAKAQVYAVNLMTKNPNGIP